MLNDIPSHWNSSWEREPVRSILEKLLALNYLMQGNQTDFKVVETSPLLGAWLHLTDRCNLTCVYCYLPHEPVNMPLETGRRAVEAIFRSAITHGYQEIKLKYAGGEPLLRFTVVKQLHQYARELAEQHQLKLDGVIISNGTLLTEKMVKEMQALGATPDDFPGPPTQPC